MAQKGGPCYRGQARLCTTSPSRLRRATSPCRRGFGSPREVNGFARGSPTRGAVERSETERLYEGKPDREPPAGLPSPSLLRNDTSPKGRGFGRPVHFLLDAESPIWRKRAGLATEGSGFWTSAPCQAVAGLDSGALLLPRYCASLVQHRPDRHANGSPFGGAGAERLRGQGC